MNYSEMAVTAGLGKLPNLTTNSTRPHLRTDALILPTKRKYFKGNRPCDLCRASNHTRCRASNHTWCLEHGCSCSCPIATNDRDDKALIAELDAEHAAKGVKPTT